MIQNKYQLIVNIKSKGYTGAIPSITANDNIVFDIQLYDGATPFDLTGVSRFTLVSMRKDNISVIREGTLVNGVIEFVLGSSETLESGRVDATLQLYDADNKRVSSAPLVYNVISDPSLSGSLPADDKTLVMANESLLTDAINKANNADTRISNIVAQAGTDNTEIVDARQKADGTTYTSLHDRLNASDESLNGKAKQTDLDTTNTNLENVITEVEAARGTAPDLNGRITSAETSLAQSANKIAGRRSITDWSNLVIDKGLTTEDWKDAFQAARDFLNSSALIQQLVFPSGVYQYSVSPNWAIQDAQIIAEGEVHLRYTGTGNAVILDGGNNGGIYNFRFGQFIIEAPTTAQNGCLARAIHSSVIDLKIQGCGSNYAVLRTEWCVSTLFNLISSVNQGWYNNSIPMYGIYATKIVGGITDGLPTSYCTFINPIIEGTQFGIYLDNALGNGFFSGTAEGCSNTGISIQSPSFLNKFFNVDLESNTTYDIYCLGYENTFIGCDTAKLVSLDTATAKQNQIIGGSHETILLSSTCSNNLISNVRYNRWLDNATLTDQGTNNRLVNNYNAQTGHYENRPPQLININVGTSPFTYTNTSGNDERILIIGGTISQVLYGHGSSGDDITGISQNFITLCPGDYLQITYTVAPAIHKFTT